MSRGVFVALALSVLASYPAIAQHVSPPIGRWQTHANDSAQPKAFTEIYGVGHGSLSGRIVEPGVSRGGLSPVCGACKGTRHNQPVIGMIIAWAPKPEGETRARLLDPEDGREYSVRITSMRGGNRPEVRGLLAAPIFGRTQVWQRIQALSHVAES